MSETALTTEFFMTLVEGIVGEAVSRVENRNAENDTRITVPDQECENNTENQEEAKAQEEQSEIFSK